VAAARGLVARGADSLLIACTELSLMFSAGANWPAPATDAMDAVAVRTVARAGGALLATGPGHRGRTHASRGGHA